MATLEHPAIDPFNEKELIKWGHEDICKDNERLNHKKKILKLQLTSAIQTKEMPS